MKNIFIIGAKGMGNYGGYETFVENLTYFQQDKNIKYYVAHIEKGNKEREFERNGAKCFSIKLPNIGPAKAIIYDIKAIGKSIEYIKKNKIENAIIYILACRIGPFMKHYKRICRKLGIKIYVNPDGHEWLRAKWPEVVKKYWKFSEKLMVKYADLLICDSKNIEKYIKENYKKYKPNTIFIAYGADFEKSQLQDNDVVLNSWYTEKNIKRQNYYLVVGRFVPENNYKTIISEFMKANTNKDLVLITNVEENKFYKKLKRETDFERDQRIKFVGTIYDKEMLKKIRENAYGYIHGHSVGGTNPSLIEALATTNINLLYDVGFNREVAEDGALYWTLEEKNLAKLIDEIDSANEETILCLAQKAKDRVRREYTWKKIVNDYEALFRKDIKNENINDK